MSRNLNKKSALFDLSGGGLTLAWTERTEITMLNSLNGVAILRPIAYFEIAESNFEALLKYRKYVAPSGSNNELCDATSALQEFMNES